MEILNQSVVGEEVTMSDVLGLAQFDADEEIIEEEASWNQPRSREQLLGFIARREAAIADFEEA